MLEKNNFTKHIAVLAFPFATHAAPLLTLIHKLSKSSPHAKFSFFSTSKSNSLIFEKYESSNSIKPYDVEDGMPANAVFSGNPLEPVVNFLKATPENFKKAMEIAVKDSGMKFSCVISDAFIWFSAELARDLNVPWIALWTGGPHSVFLHLETDPIREKLESNGKLQMEKTIDLPGFPLLPASRIPPEITPEDLNSPMESMLYKMAQNLSKANSVAINSFEEMDPFLANQLNSKLQNFLNIGPLVLTVPDNKFSDPEACLQWLNNQKQQSVVYISFGSVITLPPNELYALAEALECGKYSFIWSFRGNPDEKLPKGFLERTKEKGMVISWAPQLQILQHKSTGAFITHCGWNSVLESIIGGVPLICRPFFGDQNLNSWTVETVWKTGVEIEGGKIGIESAIKALEIVLVSEEGKKMKEKLDGLKNFAFDATGLHGSSYANLERLVKIATE